MTTRLFETGADERAERDVLDITLRFDGDITICMLDGPLCAYTAPALDRWLEQLHDNGRSRVIVDAGGVASMSSDGVAVLAAHAARFRVGGGALGVRNASQVADQVLQLCGARHLVEGASPT
jgi:anti-anti-sigma factor